MDSRLNRAEDRVRVSVSQLKAGDFPPICAMTGAPAETWRRFRFHTPPSWVWVFAFLMCIGIGFLVTVPLAYLVSPRVSGRLPLTRASAKSFQTLTWISIGVTGLAAALLIAAGVLVIAAGVLGYGVRSLMAINAAALLSFMGLPIFLLGLLGLEHSLQMTRQLIGPRGKVMKRQLGQADGQVELHNVHPAFVAAVNQMSAGRAAQTPSPN